MEAKSSGESLVSDLPRAVGAPPLMYAAIKQTPADFRVDELPAYAAEGAGEHLYVRFEKVGLDTDDAVRRIARAIGADPREAGVAGRKDKHAITTQWASFLRGDGARAEALAIDGIRVLEVTRHKNKLRTGHLSGNRFELRLRDASVSEARNAGASSIALGPLRDAVAILAARGLPNYYGEQRFGRDNLGAARAWLVEGQRGPKHPGDRKFLVSVLQSAIFNELCAERVRSERGLMTIVRGDVVKKEDTGGLFVADDVAEVAARAEQFAVSATGPMFGAAMRRAEHEAGAREQAALAAHGLDDEKLQRFSRDGEGTRRPYRVRLRASADADADGNEHPIVELDGDAIVLRFVLPAGAYATTVVRELVETVRAVPATPAAPPLADP